MSARHGHASVRCATQHTFNPTHLRPRRSSMNLAVIRARFLIMTTMPTMRSGSIPLHPEGLPISARARTERVSKATRKRHLLSKPHKVTIGDRAMQKVGVKPKTYSDHHIGSLAVHNVLECRVNHFKAAGVIPECHINPTPPALCAWLVKYEKREPSSDEKNGRLLLLWWCNINNIPQ